MASTAVSNHDDGQAGRQLQERGQQIEPLFAPQPQVEKRDIELVMGQEVATLRGGTRLEHAMVHRLQGEPQRFAEALFVVNQQNVHKSRLRACNVFPAMIERKVESGRIPCTRRQKSSKENPK
jgi:hypothetical protein